MSALDGHLDIQPRDLSVIRHTRIHSKGRDTRSVELRITVDQLQIAVKVKDPLSIAGELERALQWSKEAT